MTLSSWKGSRAEVLERSLGDHKTTRASDVCLLLQNNVKAKAESKQSEDYFVRQRCTTLCVFWVEIKAETQNECFDWVLWNVSTIKLLSEGINLMFLFFWISGSRLSSSVKQNNVKKKKKDQILDQSKDGVTGVANFKYKLILYWWDQ